MLRRGAVLTELPRERFSLKEPLRLEYCRILVESLCEVVTECNE